MSDGADLSHLSDPRPEINELSLRDTWILEHNQFPSNCLMYEVVILSTRLWSKRNSHSYWAWWYTPAIPALERLRQYDLHEFKPNLGYLVSLRILYFFMERWQLVDARPQLTAPCHQPSWLWSSRSSHGHGSSWDPTVLPLHCGLKTEPFFKMSLALHSFPCQYYAGKLCY